VISAKPQCELASNQGAEKRIGKDPPVIQPNLEIVGEISTTTAGSKPISR